MISTKYVGDKTFEVVESDVKAPAKDEVRIKVAYAGICGTDIHIYHGMMDKRVNIPMTIGHEMSGIVDAVGEEVQNFAIGDKVVVRPLDDRLAKSSDKGFNHICRELRFMGIDSPGAMQQYWNVPAFTLHKLGESTDLQLGALVEPLSVATHDVRLSGIKPGELAVVLGGGPIGLLVALVASDAGAHVIISEVNEKRIAKAQTLGFETVNPREVDLIQYVNEKSDGRMADVVFEVAGVQATIEVMTEIAGIRSRIVLVAIHGEKREVDLFKFFWKELQLIGVRVYEKEDYEKAITLITENTLPFKELITDIQPLYDIQHVFEHIDENPAGMKILMDCQV